MPCRTGTPAGPPHVGPPGSAPPPSCCEPADTGWCELSGRRAAGRQRRAAWEAERGGRAERCGGAGQGGGSKHHLVRKASMRCTRQAEAGGPDIMPLHPTQDKGQLQRAGRAGRQPHGQLIRLRRQAYAAVCVCSRWHVRDHRSPRPRPDGQHPKARIMTLDHISAADTSHTLVSQCGEGLHTALFVLTSWPCAFLQVLWLIPTGAQACCLSNTACKQPSVSNCQCASHTESALTRMQSE